MAAEEKIAIAIIEDEEAHFSLMRRAITSHMPHIAVHHFRDARDCLARMNDVNPHIFITDYVIPGMTGLELLEILRRERRDAPVIVITGQGNERVAVQAMKLGAWDYLVKSTDFFTLLPSVIEKVLREKNLKESLVKSERRFQDLAEKTSDWIWEVDMEGRFIYSNPMVRDILGYEPEEILQRYFHEFVAPEGKKELVESVRRIVGKAEPVSNLEHRLTHKDGHEVIVETRGVPFFGNAGRPIGYRGVHRDITARKQAEEALRDSESKFRAAFHESLIGKALYSPDGILIDANRAALDMFGIPGVDQIKGLNLFDDPNLPEDLKERLRKGEEAKGEIAFDFEKVKSLNLYETSKSGVILLDALIAPLGVRDRGALTGYLVHIQDITDRKMAQRELRESEERARALVENVKEGIAVIQGGALIFANKFLLRMLGYREPGDLMGRNPIELVSGGFRSEFLRFLYSIDYKQAGEESFRAKSETKAGKELWVDFLRSAVNYRNKPATLITMRDVTESALRQMEIQEEAERLKSEYGKLRSSVRERYRFRNIIGKSEVMQQVYEQIMKAAESAANVVILGESGTGKELVARAIHDLSRRGDKTFVPVNCGAIPETLIESEFFGHRKGAFTGAHRDKHGYLSSADGGTLFLDEVGEIGLAMQVKLLRATETGEYTPVGDTRPQKANIRIIAATNKNLRGMVSKGLMRDDFYYRLSVLLLSIPPLRERKEDIPLLIEHFLNLYATQGTKPSVSAAMVDALSNYNWPGNVRELQSALQRFLATGALDFLDIAGDVGALMDRTTRELRENPMDLRKAMDTFEKRFIRDTLERSRWRKGEAAEKLGVDPKTLYLKMKKLGLS